MTAVGYPFEFGGGRSSWWWCAWLFYWLTTLAVSGTLQIQQVLVPAQVMSGSNAILRCLFNEIDASPAAVATRSNNKYSHSVDREPPTGPLYSLKWYKGSHEFYRHLPGEDPSTKVFHWSQFNIEADAFEPGRVILRGVTAEAEGSYKCEVSAEGTFHTDSAEANLTVIDVQNEALTLIQDPPVEEARTGERLRWNCTFGQSRPQAQIAWLVNGEMVSASSKYTLNSSKRTESEATKRSLEWVDSTFELTLTERHFKSQWLRVSCVVSIGSAFKKTKEVHVRQQQLTGRSTHHNPSAVVGPNGSRSIGNTEFQPSMAKIAGSQRANSGGGNGSSAVTSSSFGWIASSLILLQVACAASRF